MCWVSMCFCRVSLRCLSFLSRVMWLMTVRKKRRLKTSLPNRILAANRLVCVCMCMLICVCACLSVLLSVPLWHVTVMSAEHSEGSNERFAAEVITKGMKHHLAWCFCCRWWAQYTTDHELSGGNDFDSNMSITTETMSQHCNNKSIKPPFFFYTLRHQHGTAQNQWRSCISALTCPLLFPCFNNLTFLVPSGSKAMSQCNIGFYD